jgi:hypothetical protein
LFIKSNDDNYTIKYKKDPTTFCGKDYRRRYDILVGSNGADYFDCGEGTDVVILQ